MPGGLIGAHEMISDLAGWTLGWQRQDRVCCTEEKKDVTRTHRHGHWHVDHDGQDATRERGHVAALICLFGNMMLEPQEGQRFTHLVVIMP
jgi:hypothetical protein